MRHLSSLERYSRTNESCDYVSKSYKCSDNAKLQQKVNIRIVRHTTVHINGSKTEDLMDRRRLSK